MLSYKHYIHKVSLNTHSLVLSDWCSIAKYDPAFNTVIGFLSSMNALMLNYMFILTEGFCMYLTFIGFLSSGHSVMLQKVWSLADGFYTFYTLTGFLSSMKSLMKSEGWALAEDFLKVIVFQKSLFFA
jgi:hypothetical protein